VWVTRDLLFSLLKTVNCRERLRNFRHHRHTVGVHDHDFVHSRSAAAHGWSLSSSPCDSRLLFSGGSVPACGTQIPRATRWFSVEEQSSALEVHSRFGSALSQFACQSHAEANSSGCTCPLLDLLVRSWLRQQIEDHLRRERQRANKKDKIPGDHTETRFLLSGGSSRYTSARYTSAR
jgi:hypothetical protein